MSRVHIHPGRRLRGDVRVPGDKSISHRLAMLAAIADGACGIENFSSSADCLSTLTCLRELGVGVEEHQGGQDVVIGGCGFRGLKAPSRPLDAGNSGTTVRLLSGIMAGHPFETKFTGDESLSKRPMKRVIEPLRKFGASIDARDDNYLPMTVRGGSLNAIHYALPVASAQVKSAVLLAGLFADGVTRVEEPAPTRNHTELALEAFGVRLRHSGAAIEIEGGQRLHAQASRVPGDLSSAAFLIAAALLTPESEIRLPDVGLNPTRTGFLTLVERMGARIQVQDRHEQNNELIGTLTASSSALRSIEVAESLIPNVIDEVPILAILGARTPSGIRIRGASELRVKESDRICAIVSNLRALGVDVEETPDGFTVAGNQRFRGCTVQSYGDHRIAMAFAIAGLIAEDTVTIEGAGCVVVSFPGFFETLKRLET